jgi:hypothetical protein
MGRTIRNLPQTVKLVKLVGGWSGYFGGILMPPSTRIVSAFM